MAFAKSAILSLVVVAGVQAHAASAGATQINTGGERGAYHASFCPALAGQLKLAQFDYRCAPSAGTRENMDRVPPTRASSATASSTCSRSKAGR